VSPTRLDRPYPWGALWCLVPEGDWRWRDELRQRYALARRMTGMLPVGRAPGESERKLGFFWSLPVAGFEAWQREGPDAWLRELDALWPEARERLGAGFDAGRLARAAYRDAIPRQWWRGRALLLGDAAHAMSPQLGQGANMALVDAVSLADAFDRTASLPEAFATHARERRRHLAAYHRYSRWLTPLFQSRRDALARLRDAAFEPFGRLPLARGHMLRVLSGTQQGWFGRYRLQPDFVDALRRIPWPG
jgi:2-polyprenyl-6-methoxyphenol hydroxylase-like FAD-dependent oxidoreductase